MRKIYLLEQNVSTGYESYDSMVILAEGEKEAILLSYKQAGMLISKEQLDRYGAKSFNIKGYLDKPFGKYIAIRNTHWDSWAFEKDITIQELGYADLEIKESYVVCASFNAG